MGENGRLSGRQKLFVGTLLTSRNVREAAKTAHIGETTAYRWLAAPRFQAALRQAQDETLQEVERVAANLMTAALETLAGVMADCEAPAAARVGAARGILEYGMRFAEMGMLTRRIAELERRIGAENEPARTSSPNCAIATGTRSY